MSRDLYRQVNYSAGEGLTEGDLNLAQQSALARLHDQILMSKFGDIVQDPYLSVNVTDWDSDLDANNLAFARTITAGDAVLYQGTGGDVGKIYVGPGTILQKQDVPSDGLTPSVLMFTVYSDRGDAPAALTPSAGHATLHRLDIVQVKLEQITEESESRDFEDAVTGAKSSTATDKARVTQATFSLKAGTPAALGSMVVPTPDAGYAVLGVVFIAATWTTANGYLTHGGYPAADAQARLYQASYPLGIKAYTVYANQFEYDSATNWSKTNQVAISSGAASNLKIYCPGGMGRLVGVAINGAVNSGTCTGSVATVEATTTSANTFTAWASGFNGLSLGSPAAGQYTPAYNTGLRLPLWGISGGAGPVERRIQSAFATTPFKGLALLLAASAINCRVSSVTFYMAGG